MNLFQSFHGYAQHNLTDRRVLAEGQLIPSYSLLIRSLSKFESRALASLVDPSYEWVTYLWLSFPTTNKTTGPTAHDNPLRNQLRV